LALSEPELSRLSHQGEALLTRSESLLVSQMMRDTPFLVVDRQRLERNLCAMHEHATTIGVSLRPHAKTHKSPDIARLQLQHGAVGLTVATVGEAECMVELAACTDLFIAFPLWAVGLRAQRLCALARKARLRVGVDSVDAVQRLAAAVGAGGADAAPLAVAVEIDCGHHRSGVPPERAAEIASAAIALGLVVDGVFTFPGHSYAAGMRERAAADEVVALKTARDLLVAAGIPCPVVSGGSTPSVAFVSSSSSVLTEIRPGVFCFGDAQQFELGSIAASDIALTAHATVVSRRDGVAIVDAGSKILGADRPAYASGFGRVLDCLEARIVALSEHHATIHFGSAEVPALGSVLRIVPNHVCNAVNLVDELVVRGAADESVWRVAARGKNV
jgi:D-serine deaminase-like pyridoxal phosphate-dependent protein